MANNKVVFGNETIMDITDSTVTPETLKQGEIAYNSAGQRIVGTLVTIGHKILDAFGNLMTNRENLQFQGTYVSDDSTNNKTVVPIVRSMQQAEFEQLTAAEKTGLINVLDSGYTPTEDTRLIDLKDCSIVLPGNGQILKYDSTSGKWVNVNDIQIVDNLTTDDSTKVLSAKQGKILKDDQYYKPGDTVSVYYGDTFAGRIGWAGKILIFYVPLTKKLGSGIQSITDNITHIYICSASEAKSAQCPNDTSVVTKEIFYREGWLTFKYTFVNVPTSSALDAGCNVMIGGSNWGSHFDITFN